MPTVTEVDPHDDDALRAWYAALRDGACAGREAPLVSPYDAFTLSLRSPGPRLRRIPVVATEAGRTVGALLLEMPLTGSRNTAQVEIDVPVEHRRRGVARTLWAWAVARAAEEGRPVLQTDVHVPTGESPQSWPGALFARGLGFASENVEDHLVLDLPVADDLPGRRLDPAYRLVRWAGPCPDVHLARYAGLQTAMKADVPTGGMTREATAVDEETVRTSDARLSRSHLILVTLATTADGDPAGYTLMLVPYGDPDNVLQDDTLVLRDHRSNGLGAALKAANLRQLAEHHARGRRLHTWTAESNAPMQAVNAQFGFRPVEKLHEMELRT